MKTKAIQIINLLAAIFILICFLFATKILQNVWDHYSISCPSKDVLSWDGNIRFSENLDHFQDFKDGNYGRALIDILDAPTWPAFRSILMQIIYFFNEKPNPLLDVKVSFIFFSLLFPSLLIISLRSIKKNPFHLWNTGLVFFLSILMIFHAKGVLLFSLNAMLETQGMFFMLWSLFFIYLLYDKNNIQKKTLYILYAGLFISLQGVFHTKYPYGVMLLFAILFYELFREPETYLQLFKSIYVNHYKGLRTIIFLIFAIGFIVAIKGGLAGDDYAQSKAIKKGIYFFVFLFLIDLHLFAFRNKKTFWNRFPKNMKILYYTGFMPAGIWLFVHPTRFNTVLGTQQRIIEAAGSELFFVKLFTKNFDFPLFFIAIIFIAAISLLFLTISIHKKYTQLSHTAKDLWKHPIISVLAIIFFQILMLDFATSNRQERHIYHLLPGILVFSGVLIVSLPDWLPILKIKSSYKLVLHILLFTGLTIWGALLLFSEPGYLSGKFYKNHTFCGNLNEETYEPARWVADTISEDKKYVLINTFHNLDAPVPERYLATHIDLLLRMKTLHKGKMRNDSKYKWKTWDNFDRLLVVSNICDNDQIRNLIQKRSLAVHASIRHLKITSHKQNKLCASEYVIEKNFIENN